MPNLDSQPSVVVVMPAYNDANQSVSLQRLLRFASLASTASILELE
jgi:hypothetical protein